MGRSARLSGTHRSRICGFSMVELVVSLALLLILTGIAIPSLTRSLRTYQLNDAAGRLSDMLKFTRFEAVRRNTPISFQFRQFGTDWVLWADTISNVVPDPTEKQILITGFATLLPSGAPVPGPAAISAALGGAALNTLSGSNGSVTFDARGAVRVGGVLTTNVFAFYLGSASNPEFGYRAVVLLPSGATQVWTSPAGGPWQRIG